MAFNNLQPAGGPFYLAAGASARIYIQYGKGNDHGAQWIMAHPIAGEPPSELVVSDASKVLNYSGFEAVRNGAPAYDLSAQDATYQYGVTVTNRGTQGVRFSLQGGGNT